MAEVGVDGDKYRSYLTQEDLKNTQWNAGSPNYDVVNKLFEEGRTKIWPAGSLEESAESCQEWEMELVHKTKPDEYKTLDAKKFLLGRGSYNMFFHTSLPPSLRFYNPDEETYDSSQTTFKTVFPRGFAVEILEVYSGPPVITYKFRHWGYMEGPFKGHAPTGELVEFFGIGIFVLNEESKIVKVEFFFDRGELQSGLIKSKTSDESKTSTASACPLMA